MEKAIFLISAIILASLVLYPCGYSPLENKKYNVAIAMIDYNGHPVVVGSGVLIDEKHILSVAHVALDELGNPKSDLVAISYDKTDYVAVISAFSIIHVDRNKDLVLLKTEGVMSPNLRVKLAQGEPAQDEQIFVIGNPEREINVILHGWVAKQSMSQRPYLMWLGGMLHPGNSGSGVYNYRCELVGIFNGWFEDSIGQYITTCVDLETIKQFLNEAKEKEGGR